VFFVNLFKEFGKLLGSALFLKGYFGGCPCGGWRFVKLFEKLLKG
jgi:hypothetical protein